MTSEAKTRGGPVLAALLILALLVADQAIKFWVEQTLPFQEVVPVVPYFALYRTWNEGVAFSFLSNVDGWVIIALRIAIVGFVLWWWRSAQNTGFLVHAGFLLIIAGALGNIADRFIYGHVVDYVLFHTDTWSFAVFNLADSLISVGAVTVGIAELFFTRKEPAGSN